MPKNKITLIFIIGGEEIPVEANIQTPIHVARDEALKRGEHSGRSGDEWEIKDINGNILDPNRKIDELSIADESKLYLNQKVSGGGN